MSTNAFNRAARPTLICASSAVKPNAREKISEQSVVTHLSSTRPQTLTETFGPKSAKTPRGSTQIEPCVHCRRGFGCDPCSVSRVASPQRFSLGTRVIFSLPPPYPPLPLAAGGNSRLQCDRLLCCGTRRFRFFAFLNDLKTLPCDDSSVLHRSCTRYHDRYTIYVIYTRMIYQVYALYAHMIYVI